MMTVYEYASDMNKSVDEILSLCKRININANDGDYELTDDDIIMLDNEIENTEVEEEEVLDEIYSNEVTDIEIVKIKKGKSNDSVNRVQKEKKDFLIRYINKEKNSTNLKYLYYDYFEKDEEDTDKIREILATDPIEIPKLENSPTLNQQNRRRLYSRSNDI